MGFVQFGAPTQCVTYLQDAMGLTTFVEGGTYQGGTSRWASERFARVITMENSMEMHTIASQNLQGIGNVSLLLGDSRQHLPNIAASEDNVLYWLDAHWSGGVTYGEGDECPLLEELAFIFKADQNCAILVDDARLFLAPPPLPHQRNEWPTLIDICNALPTGWDCICHDDVLSVIPPSMVEPYRDFLQQQISEKSAQANSTKKPSRLKRWSRRLTG